VAITSIIIRNNTKTDNMPFIKTELEGLLVFEPVVFEDERGFFYESYNKRNFIIEGLNMEFVQDNQSLSRYGVVRGLHFQHGNNAQAKLVSVLKGAVLDVVVDIRTDSPTYGKSFSIELNETSKKQLFVPEGFAHGYSVLSKTALFYYKCNNYYNKEAEGGINLKDAGLNIDWQIPVHKMIISEKDLVLPDFKDALNYF
jgi:dTDP-4-dehydrorhamnose 3,5-epimerase